MKWRKAIQSIQTYIHQNIVKYNTTQYTCCVSRDGFTMDAICYCQDSISRDGTAPVAEDKLNQDSWDGFTMDPICYCQDSNFFVKWSISGTLEIKGLAEKRKKFSLRQEKIAAKKKLTL